MEKIAFFFSAEDRSRVQRAEAEAALVIAKEFGVQQFKKSTYPCDLDLDPMTLKLKLDVVTMSHHTKNEIIFVIIQKLWPDRHTDSMKTLPSGICRW